MTTGLCDGMTRQQAVEAVAAKAQSLRRPEDVLALWTESGAKTVLIGVATTVASFAIEVDKEAYCGLKLLEFLDGRFLPEGPSRKSATRR